MASKLKMFHPYTKQEFIDSVKAILAEMEISFVVRNALSIRLEWAEGLDDGILIVWELDLFGYAQPRAFFTQKLVTPTTDRS